MDQSGMRRRRRGSRRNNAVDRPLPFSTGPVITGYRVRYQVTSSSAITTTVSPTQLIQSWFCTYDSSTTVMSVVQAVRIRYVEGWLGSGGGSIFTPNTLGLGWQAATNFGRDVIKQDLSITASQAAHVRLNPVKGAASSEWQTTQSNQPWTLVLAVSQGAILDICCDVLLNSSPVSATNNAFKTVSATPGVGIVYFINLVTAAGGSLTLQPQGVVSIS
jgi:hypothetical protein